MQIAKLLSCALERYSKAWQIQFSCVKDDGSVGMFSIVFIDKIPWTSPDGLAEVSVAGLAEKVLLPCPPQIQAATFGVGG